MYQYRNSKIIIDRTTNFGCKKMLLILIICINVEIVSCRPTKETSHYHKRIVKDRTLRSIESRIDQLEYYINHQKTHSKTKVLHAYISGSELKSSKEQKLSKGRFVGRDSDVKNVNRGKGSRRRQKQLLTTPSVMRIPVEMVEEFD